MEKIVDPTHEVGSPGRRRRRPTRVEVLGYVETGERGWPLVLARMVDERGEISLRARTLDSVREVAKRIDLWIERPLYIKDRVYVDRYGPRREWVLGWLVRDRDLHGWVRDGQQGWRRLPARPRYERGGR